MTDISVDISSSQVAKDDLLGIDTIHCLCYFNIISQGVFLGAL